MSEDLENDPFLISALQRFTCELYYRFGSFLLAGIIYQNTVIKMEVTINLTTEKPRKSEGLGATMAAELIIGFWFGIGLILAGTVWRIVSKSL